MVADSYLTEDVLVPWLQRFVAHPSEQTDLQERDPRVVGFIAECVAPLLADLGHSHRFDAMGNLIMEAGAGRTGSSILFMTYAMTHPAANMADPFEAAVVETPGGRAVRGRGVAEQKTALTAALGAVAEALREGGIDGRLIFTVSTAGETGRHDAAASIAEAIRAMPDFAVVCLGTDNRVAAGNKGRIDFDLVVKGRATHSATPWKGVNALAGAWRVLRQMEGLDLGVPEHPEFGPATLTATAIESGPRATHTVQDTARVTFDRRLLPGEDAEAAYRAITEAVTLEAPWTLESALGPVMYPNRIDPAGPLMGLVEQAYADAGAGAPGVLNADFALDAGFFGHKGVEAVMMGPGEVDQFHSDDERVLVSDLLTMARVYHRMIRRAVGSGPV